MTPCPDPSFWDLTAADVFTTIGTLAAVGVAVYVGVLRDRFRRPKLSLMFEQGTSDTIVVTARRVYRVATTISAAPEGHVEFETAYLRIRVRNDGPVTAEQVEVTITRARESQVDPQVVRVDGLPLVYSNSSDATSLHVSPGAERHLDLAHVEFEEGVNPERPVQIDIYPTPVDDRLASIGEGTLELELTITARNIDAVRYALELHFSGDNTDVSSIWERLRVAQLRRL